MSRKTLHAGDVIRYRAIEGVVRITGRDSRGAQVCAVTFMGPQAADYEESPFYASDLAFVERPRIRVHQPDKFDYIS